MFDPLLDQVETLSPTARFLFALSLAFFVGGLRFSLKPAGPPEEDDQFRAWLALVIGTIYLYGAEVPLLPSSPGGTAGPGGAAACPSGTAGPQEGVPFDTEFFSLIALLYYYRFFRLSRTAAAKDG